MSNIINIERIFKETWGYIGLPVPELIINRFVKDSRNLTEERAQDFKFNSREKLTASNKGVLYYGYNVDTDSDVFMPVRLFEAEDMNTSMILENAVMSFTNKKNIVSTQLVNRDGEVNEEISFGSWEIDVKGVFVGSDGNYPEAKVEALRELYSLRKSLNIQNVRSAICLTGTNEKVIIEDLKFPELRGYENTQPYQLKLKSDVEFSLYID